MIKSTALLLSLLSALGAFAGCSTSSSSSSTKTSTVVVSTSSATGVPVASQAALVRIRNVDVSAVADVKRALDNSGGAIVKESIIYADVTRDGVDEAIIPINSGGTLGDIGFVVLTPASDGTKTLLDVMPKDGHGLFVAVEGGKIIVTAPAPGPDDPNCCPSNLRKTIYAWNGAALAVESDTIVPNPNGGGKKTPAPSSGEATPGVNSRPPGAGGETSVPRPAGPVVSP